MFRRECGSAWRLLAVVAVLMLLGARLTAWLSQPAFAPPPESLAQAPHFRAHADAAAAPAPDAGAPTIEPFPAAKPARTPALRRTLNILLVGTDRRPGQRWGGRPDTIVVAILAQDSDHIGLVSIPRDLYVAIPGHGFDRINATFGVARQGKIDPLVLLSRVVEDTLGLPIRHSLAIHLSGFENFIDALGGVDVDVPCAIRDNFIDPRAPTGRRPLDVGVGLQHMNGVTAAMYVRSRHGRSDFSRARRQQAVLLGLKRQLLSVHGLGRLPRLWDELGQLLETRMSRAAVLGWALRAAQSDLAHVHGLVLGASEVVPWRTPDNRAVLLPDHHAIDRALAQLFSAPAPGTLPAFARCPEPDVALRRTVGAIPSRADAGVRAPHQLRDDAG